MNTNILRYFCLNKPYLMQSQFSKQGTESTLADVKFSFPKDAYPLGRLDADSEGLLLITNDKEVNDKLLNPKNQHKRVYIAQVEKEIDEEGCLKLSKGVNIQVNGNTYTTKPTTAEIISQPDWIKERNPPIRFRLSVPTSWVKLTLTEGKNRQVRKMTAAVGFPTLRLLRYSIEDINISELSAGEVKEMDRKDFYKELKLR